MNPYERSQMKEKYLLWAVTIFVMTAHKVFTFQFLFLKAKGSLCCCCPKFITQNIKKLTKKIRLWADIKILYERSQNQNISYEQSQDFLWPLIRLLLLQLLSRSIFPPKLWPFYTQKIHYTVWKKRRKKSYVSGHNTWPLTTYNLHLFIQTIWGNKVPVCIGY